MSHTTGTVQPVNPAITIGPSSGLPADAPNTWTVNFAQTEAPMGTRFVVLHFHNASFPANNRLEVDLGYDTDVFNAASGTNFWTRPINLKNVPGGLVPIRYITDGAPGGGVQLFEYGRGERSGKDPDPQYAAPIWNCLTNCDPFFMIAPYLEPDYAKYWFCNDPPNWENIRLVPEDDIRRQIAPSVGMIVSLHGTHISTCTGTLVGPDLFMTAGHCLTDVAAEVASASVTFDYETDSAGDEPDPYNARFHKVAALVARRYGFFNGISYDYTLLRLKAPPGGIGVPHVQMRHDIPAAGERVFGIHHPNGAVKKLTIPHPGLTTVISSTPTSIRVNMDCSGGSSGSGLFDEAGRVVGILAASEKCFLGYFPTASMIGDVTTPLPDPPITRDVMLVIDRSGSMASPGTSGRTKIAEARDAASLFVQLVRADAGNRVGMVSFSTTASAPVDFALADLTAANKTALVGAAPYSTGSIGLLTPGGTTSIGAGIDAARMQLAPGLNPRTILLLTDGLQNTPPTIDMAAGMLGEISVDAIGYGTDANLNGDILSALALAHDGTYVRADTSLQLEKFFAQAFGNIFASGLLTDPEFVLPKDQREAKPFPFSVCGEETITAVVGWDRPDSRLHIQLRTPSGVVLHEDMPGIESATGITWTFLRVPLPYGPDRDGTWHAEVARVVGAGTTSQSTPELRYFINVIAGGGPSLRIAASRRRYYTGDAINPTVRLTYPDGSFPHDARVHVIARSPDTSVGNVLTKSGLRRPVEIEGDTIGARQATLTALEQESGRPVVGYSATRHELFDGPGHRQGPMEAGGIFGTNIDDLLKNEGDYTFHFRAEYGEGCTATRELFWTAHVGIGISGSHTDVLTDHTGVRGRLTVGTLTITPRDAFGNHLGPGRSDAFEINGGTGTTLDGSMVDNGDGTYTAPVAWDPVTGPPSLVITQPDRPPVVAAPSAAAPPAPTVPPPAERPPTSHWKLLFWLALILAVVLLVLLLKR